MVPLTKTNVAGWPGHRWTVGAISLGFVPQLGGRLMSLTCNGEELLFTQEARRGETVASPLTQDLRATKKALGFPVWGGDKTWVAPQKEWWEGTPPLDLDTGAYTFETSDMGVTMTSPLCRETGLRVTRAYTLKTKGQINLTETLRNEGSMEIQRGLWNVTQCLRPFKIYAAGPLSSWRAYEGEGDIAKAKKYGQQEGSWTVISCQEPVHFKWGGKVTEGAVIATRSTEKETLFFARFFEAPANGRYAHDAVVEIYNSPAYNYCEIEIHAPWKPLAPGEEISFTQRWVLQKTDAPFQPHLLTPFLSQPRKDRGSSLDN